MSDEDDEEIATATPGLRARPDAPPPRRKPGAARFLSRDEPRTPLLHFDPPVGRGFDVALDASTCGRSHRLAKDDEESGPVVYCTGARRKDGCGLCPRRTLLWLAKSWGAFDFMLDSGDRGKYALGVGREDPDDETGD